MFVPHLRFTTAIIPVLRCLSSFQSEETIFATYNNAGVRVFDIRDAFAPKEIAYWVPPLPNKMVDPRPHIALAAKTRDAYVRPDGLMFVSDWNAACTCCNIRGSTEAGDAKSITVT